MTVRGEAADNKLVTNNWWRPTDGCVRGFCGHIHQQRRQLLHLLVLLLGIGQLGYIALGYVRHIVQDILVAAANPPFIARHGWQSPATRHCSAHWPLLIAARAAPQLGRKRIPVSVPRQGSMDGGARKGVAGVPQGRR